MGGLSQKMRHQTPKLSNEKLSPVRLWACSALRDFLAPYSCLSWAQGERNIPHEGSWDWAAFTLWEHAVCPLEFLV